MKTMKKYTPWTLQEIEEYNGRFPPRSLRGAALAEYKKLLKLDSIQRSVMIGTLLGDSSMSIRGGKASYGLRFEQSRDRLDYVEHLYYLFEPFVGTGPKVRQIHNSFHKDPGSSCWFRTYSHIYFKYYADLFYHVSHGKRVKRVPKNIHKYLDVRALTYWFMDDGSYSLDGKHLIFNTQGFTFSDQKILLEALKRNFNLVGVRKKDKEYTRLQLDVDSSKVLAKIIQPYLHDRFFYKLNGIGIY